MRFFMGVILLAAVLTGALLWNVRGFAPEPAQAAGRALTPVRPVPPTPFDQIVLVVGTAPGLGSAAAKPAVPPASLPRAQTPEPPPPAADPPSPQEPVPQATRRVRLQKGETIYGLAERLLGKGSRYKEILELNGLSEDQARRLRQGTLLALPPR